MSLEEQYHTGVIWQDFQHRELMSQVIKLKTADKEAEKDAFRFSVTFLAMYVHHHFKLEEEYMGIYRYPDREAHQKEHKAFIKRLREFRANHRQYSEAAREELLEQLNDWILTHIFKDDKTLGKYILEAEKE